MEVPRYTDETGKIVSHFDTLSSALPPSDHEWVGDWKLIVELESKQTDSNGWSYGINFSNLSKGTYVRTDQGRFFFFFPLFLFLRPMESRSKFHRIIFAIGNSAYHILYTILCTSLPVLYCIVFCCIVLYRIVPCHIDSYGATLYTTAAMSTLTNKTLIPQLLFDTSVSYLILFFFRI